jgi:hypothetical protein
MKPQEHAAALDQPAPVPDAAASRRLHQFGCAGLVAAVVWFLYQSGGDVGFDTLLGLGILILSSLPALQWAGKRRTWFPAFEIGMLTCIAFYAIPLLSKHTELSFYRASVINEAAFVVLLYLLAANLGFAWVRNPARAPRWAISSLVPEQAYRHIPIGMALNTIYLYIANFTYLVPADFVGTMRALFFGLGTLCTFILARLLGLGLLSRNAAAFFIVNLTIQVIILFGQLYLITGLSLVALALIAYSAARRQIPWRFLIVFVPLLALLHAGKADMRRDYWEEKKPMPSIVELPRFFSEWIAYSLTASEREEETNRSQTSIFERASLIQMLCLSVDRVPSIKPHLNGESYVDIPAQLIPRFLWPNKPSSLLANVRLALHFNLVTVESALSVSIAFGMIAEAYINFGYLGVIGLGLLFGAGFKRIAQLAQDAPQFSALGILMILLTAWSFQVELVLSTWLSSLFQASVICIGLPLVYKRFTTA